MSRVIRSFVFGDEADAEFKALLKQSGLRTAGDLLRHSLAVMKTILDETGKGGKLLLKRDDSFFQLPPLPWDSMGEEERKT